MAYIIHKYVNAYIYNFIPSKSLCFISIMLDINIIFTIPIYLYNLRKDNELKTNGNKKIKVILINKTI